MLTYVGYHKIIYCDFLTFLNSRLISPSKTLSASSISSNMIHFSVFYLPFIIFYCISYNLTTVHLVPSSGLKKSADFYYTITQKGKFVFATFSKILLNKISMLGIHHAKYCDFTINGPLKNMYTSDFNTISIHFHFKHIPNTHKLKCLSFLVFRYKINKNFSSLT